jgi:hypothetical protein
VYLATGGGERRHERHEKAGLAAAMRADDFSAPVVYCKFRNELVDILAILKTKRQRARTSPTSSERIIAARGRQSSVRIY